MSTITGDDVTYSAAEMVGATGDTILRNGFVTDASNDAFPSAVDLINEELGNQLDNVGQSFGITIHNNNVAALDINLAMGVGMTLSPATAFTANADVILWGESRTYQFIVTTATTLTVLLASSATGGKLTGVALPDTNLLIGGADGYAQTAALSGDGTISNTGAFTLSSTIPHNINFSAGVGASEVTTVKLTGLNPPVAATDAVNKNYVDSFAAGLSWHKFVRLVGDADVPITGEPILDGVQTNAGDRILLIGQTNGVQNGIWLVVGAAAPFVRPIDFPDGSVASAATVRVSDGLVYKTTAWVCTNESANSIVDTDPLTWVQWSATTAGITEINGLTGPVLTMNTGTTGTDFNIDSSANNLQLNLPDASTANRGVITNAAQTLGGEKTFTDGVKLGGLPNSVGLNQSASSTGPYNLEFPPDIGTTSQYLSLSNGTGSLQWSSPGALSFWYGYGPTVGVLISGALQTIDFAEQLSQNETYPVASGIVTMPTTGYYQITYWVQMESFDNTGSARSSAAFLLRVKRGANPVASEVGGSSACYIREQNNSNIRPGAGKTVILQLDAGDTIQVAMQRVAGGTTAITAVNESTLVIQRMK